MTRSVHGIRYERLVKALIDARKASGLTQTQVAKKLRRPQSYVSKYERGERRLDVIEFVEVTEAIDAKPSDILNELRR